MQKTNLNICIGGAAGQGIVTIGQIIAQLLTRKGYYLHTSQVYESRVRGGYNGFALRTGTAPLFAPVDEIDILVALNPNSFHVNQANLAQEAVVLSDVGIAPEGRGYFQIPFKDMGAGARANTIMVGTLGALLGFAYEDLAAVLAENLAKLDESALNANLNVLRKAYDWTTAKQHTAMHLPKAPMPPNSNLLLNCNNAVTLGALAAGLKFYAFYPMSPSTNIAEDLAAVADEMGIVMEQAEDEIAAVNMVIGASYAGARGMAATSGGGMDLMCEGVSLAGMLEIPLVINIGMRPGPATGLPTRMEQADLNLALYAGHGEFPRAIFAPGTIEQSFKLTKHAFATAEKYNSPVFILTDQYLVDSLRSNAPLELGEAPKPPAELFLADENGFEPYALTETGVSPRRLPGFGQTLVVVDSDEHTPNGHITEDLTMRVKMQDKRMAKLKGLQHDALPPLFSGAEKPEILLVCWGGTIGAVEEAATCLQAQKRTVGVCHFVQVYPLRASAFMDRFNAASQVVVVESNCTGQLARLIQRETGFKAHQNVLRYDGLAMTAQYILTHIQKS